MQVLKKEEIFPVLKEILSKAKKQIIIVSPWIKGDVLKELLPDKQDIDLQVIIRSSNLEDLLITDPATFDIVEKLNGKLFLNPDIHSKFVIVDEEKAVLGSANITGSGLLEDGNIETAVLIKEESQINRLKEYFLQIKEKSIDIKTDVLGFVINSINSRQAEALLLKNLPEQTYIKIPIDENAFYLGRISTIKSINLSLVSSFSNTVFKNIFTRTDRLRLTFNSKNELWKNSALIAYLFENNESFFISDLEILAEFNPQKVKEKESIIKTPLQPLQAGTLIVKLKDQKQIKDILKINHAGYKMEIPVEFGKLFNTNLPVFLDLDKVTTMHMAVLGTTGSGKTTFIRRLLEHLTANNIKIFIFDLYGEYYSSLKINRKYIEHTIFPDTIFPITVDDIKEIFKEEGIIVQEKSLEEKRLLALFREYLKPDLSMIVFKQKDLEDVLLEATEITDISGYLRKELISFIQLLKRDFGESSLKSQPDIVKSVQRSFNTDKKIVIYNLGNITDAKSRVNISGLIMKEIFTRSKEKKDKWMVILEEAQNFAPEKGFGDIPAGSENLSYLMAKKIATEGRKFDLGLVAITQRPANISKYVLSQLNTQVIFKIINKNDLDAVSVFFEFSKEDVYSLLPFLKPGTLYITGLAVPFGLLAEIKLG